MEWYEVLNADEIDSPALIVYSERVVHNIRKAIQLAKDVKRIRPHIKTHKSIEVLKLFRQEGIDKVKCSGIAEVEIAAQAGIHDIMLAYPVVGPKIKRLVDIICAYPTSMISCIVDNSYSASVLGAVASQNNISVNVFIDVNVGQGRTGVDPKNFHDLWVACKEIKGIRPIGIHGYDGHNHDSDFANRTAIGEAIYKIIHNLQVEIGEQLVVVLGGSPAFPIYANYRDVELSPGTFVYWDTGYSNHYPDQPFIPAAVVLCRVVSIINEKKLCLDLGYKAIASENPLHQRLQFLNRDTVKLVGHYEEHLVVEVDDTRKHTYGEVWYAIPYHICPTVNLYEKVQVVEEHVAKLEWTVEARGRKLSF